MGDPITERQVSGGQSVFWSDGVKPVDAAGRTTTVQPQPVGTPVQLDAHTTRQVLVYPAGTRLKGFGNFRVEFLLYKPLLDMSKLSTAMLNTLELPLKIVLPFAVMIMASFATGRNRANILDRFYAKMKTEVDPDPDVDRRNLEAAFAGYGPFESRKILPHSDFEMERPSKLDVVGFIATLLACFGVVLLAIWVASLGS
jgi:SSS family solute:Na+ symporter